jgi:hypothetical protein
MALFLDVDWLVAFRQMHKAMAAPSDDRGGKNL